MINFTELRKLKSLSEAVQTVTEASNNNTKMVIDQSGGIHLQYKGKTVINTTSTNLQDTSYETSADFDFVDEIHKRFVNVIGMVQKVKKLVPEMDGILSKKKNQAYTEGSLKLEKADKSEIILSFSIKGNPSLSSLKTSIQPNEVVKVFDEDTNSESTETVTEAPSSNEMSISVEDDSGWAEVKYAGKEIISSHANDIESYGPMGFIAKVLFSEEYTKVDQMEKAIAKLEKEGLTNDDGDEEVEAEEQAYVPKSLKIKQDGSFKIYSFKLKPKFSKKVVLNNLFAPDLN